jgi:hypothetical protein
MFPIISSGYEPSCANRVALNKSLNLTPLRGGRCCWYVALSAKCDVRE